MSGSRNTDAKIDSKRLRLVLEREEGYWRARREALGLDLDDPLFGVALSGGGVRSATLSAGFLDVLQKIGLLQHVDYLSTVSGGGFLGGYVHEKLRHCAESTGHAAPQAYEALFSDTDREKIRRSARYLAPGIGIAGLLNSVVMAVAYAVSTLINLVWLLSFFGCIVIVASLLLKPLRETEWLNDVVGLLLLIVLLWHILMHWARHYRLLQRPIWSSIFLNRAEALLAGLFALLLTAHSQFILGKDVSDLIVLLLLGLIVLVVSGIVSNPNVLTMHRYYRDRLANAFLDAAHDGGSRRRLSDLVTGDPKSPGAYGPFPLINTCLNLAGKDEYAGQQSSDYFLLSPLFCGAKLVGYAETDDGGFERMTLATAIAASGAALNPGMGARSGKVLAFLMAVLNLRLGYWVHNPRFRFKLWFSVLSQWWYYQVSELMSRTKATARLLNVSDGGFVDNLGVIELLRRRCKIMVVLDATADPDYAFSDLTNLVIRARNELGLNISFRPGQEPEDVIQPKPSRGFSESQFAIADVRAMEGNDPWSDYSGLLIYVKSSMLEQKVWQIATEWTDETKGRSYHYKTYHASFPHESTANQFFDAAQWEAYYELGRHLAAALAQVRIGKLDAGETKPVVANELFKRWQQLDDLEALLDYRLEPRLRSKGA